MRKLKPKKYNILVITSWSFHDALIQSHTLPYLRIIHELHHEARIYLVTQEREGSDLSNETKEQLAGENIFLVSQRYYRFGLLKLASSIFQLFQLFFLIFSKKITRIHCFCTPAGSLGYILSRMTGRPLVLDSFEPHAESMVENGTWQKDGMAFKLLWMLEKKQVRRACHHIGIASGMDDYALKKYGVKLNRVGLKPSCVDLDFFAYDAHADQSFREKMGWAGKIVCVYAGKFGGIYLEDEVFGFFKEAYEFWGDRFRILLLTGESRSEINRHAMRVGIPNHLFHVEFVPFQKIPKYMSVGNFAITPVKPVPSKRYCSPIKDGEYWSIGLPVVITEGISDDSDIIRIHNAGYVLPALDQRSYQDAVQKIDALLQEDRQVLRERIRKVAIKYRNFDIAVQEYKIVYP